MVTYWIANKSETGVKSVLIFTPGSLLFNNTMGCARGLGLGEQHVQDKSSQNFYYILSRGVARILVRGAFNLILFKNFLNILKKLI